MTDTERVAGLMVDIKKYTTELESYKIKSVEDLKDSKTFFASSMVAFRLINRVFDLCDDIINSRNMGVPAIYKDIFWLLEKGKVIDKSAREKVWPVMKYRNLLAHEYGEISGEDILFIINNLEQIKWFVKKLSGGS